MNNGGMIDNKWQLVVVGWLVWNFVVTKTHTGRKYVSIKPRSTVL